ncbi:MAG: hypothetical protein ABIN96_09795, partial [Rubrivivax sp.]
MFTPLATSLARIGLRWLPLLASGIGVCLAGAVRAAVLTISCTGVGIESDLCRSGAQDWARQTGNEVRVVTPPSDASERLALYRQLLAAHADT